MDKNVTLPEAVTYLLGEFEQNDGKSQGLMAPLYFNKEKDLYLYSHHPKGMVWDVAPVDNKFLSLGSLRGIKYGKAEACPHTEGVRWEWYHNTTTNGQHIYLYDESNKIQVKCLDE